MLLGKRPRPPIRRTTSMTGITVDVGDVEDPAPCDQQNPMTDLEATVVGSNGYDQRFLAMVSPRTYQRSSVDNFLETAHFLRTCGLCQRRLAPGRDIYMYRGDTAFCSQECREQQMKVDERKEKCSLASKKGDPHAGAGAGAGATAAAGATSKARSKGETMAAA